MSVRNDITINWNATPRIILIAAPSTQITMQDLIDTLREAEMNLCNLSYPHIVDSAGKESLGEEVYVGITLTLRNAKLQFADRSNPPTIQCYILGGNLVAVDENGVPMELVEPSDYVQVIMVRAAASTIIETGVSGLTQEESAQLFKTLTTSKFLLLK